ncbi:hypothetical protein [Acidovorax sp. M2(2025)]|uniref:hypothetical protein n=1 Tax=Acidovorax sp. M2(2025) TaxID=3411355 RepID=UPI003BF5959F
MKTTRAPAPGRCSAATLLLALGWACAGLARAEAPMTTDDAGTLDRGAFKVESTLHRDDRARGVDLALGAGVAEGLELGVAVSRDKDRQTRNAVETQGQGLSLKWVPLQADAGWSLGARLDLNTPRTHTDAAPQPVSTRERALLALATYRQDRWALHFNAGQRSTKTLGVRDTAVTWAAGAEAPLTDALQLTAEIHGEQRARPDKALGVRYTLAEGLKLSASAGWGSGRTFAQAGVAWEFR